MPCPTWKNQGGSPAEPAKIKLKAIGNDRKGPTETGARAAGRAGEKEGATSCEQVSEQADGPTFRIVESNRQVRFDSIPTFVHFQFT